MQTPRTPDRPCVLLAPPPGGVEQASVFGLTPVERTALAFARAGIRHFLLAGDPGGVAQTARILSRGPCRRLRVRAVEALPQAVGDDVFYVARTDCHYDRQLVARFVEETRGAADTVVAVDFRADARKRGPELPRASVWSREKGARVQRVARQLVGSDGVLVGLAVATPGWARCAGAAPGPDGAWLGGLATLLTREPVESWSVTERWHAIRAPEDVSAARREVLAGSVRVGDGLVARHLNRPISRRITERLLSRPVKPWQISIASFALTLAAGLSFAVGHALTGGLLAQSASVLDGVDGELARVRYQDSAFGGLYDALLDRVGEAAVIGGMTVYAWLMGAGASAVAIGFAALAGNSLSMLVKEKYGTQFRQPWMAEREGRLRWLLLGRDGRLFLTLVAGMTGQVELVLAYLAVGTHVQAGARLVRIRSEAARA
jgi:1L-myo-inositol 1-phosphate cytidylyltransferase / CDP-L-myo-inositol myo-inositolphosphotransferase